MGTYAATITWQRNDAVFTDKRYSRAHIWQFDGGCTVPASSSPHIVPLPLSDASAVDPEEAFVASLSSCHMLCFLSIAANRGFVVNSYRDEALGVMEKCVDGKLSITLVTLRPCVTFSGDRIPSPQDIHDMHHEAHAECFIANSVRTDVRCEPVLSTPTHNMG
ncbi:MAG: OsmC family protein [Pirellulaceae bacterium]|nr:OsmC family protein [Pirellulaceae bacterium]